VLAPVAESSGLVKPNRGRAQRIAPEQPAEVESRPGRCLPVTEGALFHGFSLSAGRSVGLPESPKRMSVVSRYEIIIRVVPRELLSSLIGRGFFIVNS
jgi:hypothetical protein